MSNLSLQFKLLDNQKEISKKILEALLPLAQEYFERVTDNLSNNIADIIISYIKNEPEYESLLNGTLKYEFGIPDAGPRIEFILSHIKSSGVTKIQNPIIRGNRIVASYQVQLIKSDFENLLAVGSSSFTTEKGQQLDWLRWLLIEGDTIIITGYEFEFGPNIGSRTGMGIMKMGNSWRVPPEFAGNVNNNWITRGINSAVPEIDQYLMKAMEV
jgi:hypothetical protein